MRRRLIMVISFSICLALTAGTYIYNKEYTYASETVKSEINNDNIYESETIKPQKITIEEGLELINKINGTIDKSIKYIQTEENNGEDYFVYEDDSFEFHVTSNSGNISRVSNKKLTPSLNYNLDSENAKVKGLNNIQKYMPNANIENMKLVKNEKHDGGSFVQQELQWKEYNTEGIFTGTSIFVTLNGNGELDSLCCYESSIKAKELLNAPNKITNTEAIDKAFSKVQNYLKDIGHENVLKTKDDYNILNEKMVYKENVVWKVQINGVQDYVCPDTTDDFTIHVDCSTGEIIEFSNTY